MQVTNYVIERVAALRREEAGTYTNISALRTNAIRHLPNYFAKGQLEKLFFLFPVSQFLVHTVLLAVMLAKDLYACLCIRFRIAHFLATIYRHVCIFYCCKGCGPTASWKQEHVLDMSCFAVYV